MLIDLPGIGSIGWRYFSRYHPAFAALPPKKQAACCFLILMIGNRFYHEAILPYKREKEDRGEKGIQEVRSGSVTVISFNFAEMDRDLLWSLNRPKDFLKPLVKDLRRELQKVAGYLQLDPEILLDPTLNNPFWDAPVVNLQSGGSLLRLDLGLDPSLKLSCAATKLQFFNGVKLVSRRRKSDLADLVLVPMERLSFHAHAEPIRYDRYSSQTGLLRWVAEITIPSFPSRVYDLQETLQFIADFFG